MMLEVCVDSVESAINAQKGGADRLELCGDLVVGGTTPSLALYEEVRKTVDLPIHVLLRPRFGDFLYSEHELNILMRQASLYHDAGADALVVGCLTCDGNLDLNALECIQSAARGTVLHLHRAFDMCADFDKALEDAKKLGIDAILTSGGHATALEGADVLKRLKSHAENVEIMAGSGINAEAIRQLKASAGLTSFHMSGKKVLQSHMRYRNSNVNMGLPSLSEYEIWQTDVNAVRLAKEALLI